MSKKDEVEYTCEVELPSRGRFYSGKFSSGKVIMRAMTTAEEKKIFGSFHGGTLTEVIQSCIKSDMDMEDMLIADQTFLLLKLRAHTYGPDYGFKFKCQSCGKANESIVNLDELDVYHIDDGDDDYKEPTTIELPMSKDKIGIALPRIRDINALAKDSTRILKRSSELKSEEVRHVLELSNSIKSVNGRDDMSFQDRYNYADALHARDASYLRHKLDSLVKIGHEMLVDRSCSSCRTNQEVMIPIGSEFFRPKFRD